MKSILIATHNQGKAREFQEMLGSFWQVLTYRDVPELPQVIEDGLSFEANAVKKVLSCAKIFNGYVLADDSGLEVDALGGAPGIISARFAGEPSSDVLNNNLLLSKMAHLSSSERGAQFKCSLALAQGSQLLGTFEGIIRGSIQIEPTGSGGFGYDPLFIPEGYHESFAQLGAELKHKISHRSQALAKLLEYLKTL